jgi:nucleoside-diphosphate-sugar epimerase
MNNVCAITGSNGYVGGCVKNYFAARDWEILELTRRPKSNSHAIKFQLGEKISSDELAGVNALVHCAYDFKPLRWKEIVEINVEGSRKILEAARTAKIPKIIFISSISAFDDCKSLYGKAKLEIEKIALDCGALVIRPGLVYGNDSGGMFGKLSAQIGNSSVIPMIGDGSQIQFLVHNEDLCAFIEKLATGKIQIEPQILTAANPEPWPFKKLLLEIARSQNKKIKFIPLPWRLVWLGLKSAELCGLKLNFRSDSLVSLMNQNPKPDFSTNAKVGLICRPFEIEKLKK